MNMDNLTKKRRERVIDSALVKKIVAMISGPTLAYLGILAQGHGVLANILGFLPLG